jgi:hypothetical protein
MSASVDRARRMEGEHGAAGDADAIVRQMLKTSVQADRHGPSMITGSCARPRASSSEQLALHLQKFGEAGRISGEIGQTGGR